MPESNRELSRRLASEALSEMTSPGQSFENVVRKALRVATLRKHVYTSTWLRMQLLDVMVGKPDYKKVKEVLDDAFPDAKVRQEVAHRVTVDYFLSRSVQSKPDKIYGSPIHELEKLVAQGDNVLDTQPGHIPNEFIRSVRENSQMLNTIKNRVQTYLMQVEADETPGEETAQGEPEE